MEKFIWEKPIQFFEKSFSQMEKFVLIGNVYFTRMTAKQVGPPSAYLLSISSSK